MLRRAFLAVVPPPDVLLATDALVERARRDDDGLRWSRTEQRHLTLQFLGPVADVDVLTDALAEPVAAVTPFVCALGGAGAFPSARRASVLWLGVSVGADALAALATTVVQVTAPLGFAADDRPYRPHLTLARSTRTRDLRSVVEGVATGPAGPSFTVDQVVLFESDTRSDGVVHTARARFGLGALA